MTPARVFWVGVVALAAFNLARAAGAFGGAADVVGLVVAGALVVVARRSGIGSSELGLARDRAGAGLRWGAAAFGVVAAAVVVAALVPATAGFLDDDRARIGLGALVLELAVSILLLTVVPEELAFRGVLLGAATRARDLRTGVVATSALFGLWHVAPTLATSSGNAELAEASSTAAGTAVVVVGAVLLTFGAGLVFSWLRVRSGSVVAPMLAHLGTNGATLVVAWVVAG